MASPQVEKGFTRIANEILNVIMKTNLNGTQFRIVIAIWRLTYGFGKKEKEISYAALADHIDASRSQVAREIGILIDRKIILVLGKGTKGASILKFNKNYEEWIDSNGEKRVGKLMKDKDTVKEKQPKKGAPYDRDQRQRSLAQLWHHPHS